MASIDTSGSAPHDESTMHVQNPAESHSLNQTQSVSIHLPAEPAHLKEIATERLFREPIDRVVPKREGVLSRIKNSGLAKAIAAPFKPIGSFIKEQVVENGIGSEEGTRTRLANKMGLLARPDAEEIRFGFQDGPLLEGILFGFDEPPVEGQKTVLLCTGSARPAEEYAIPMVSALREMGHRVMIFNYEGFGQSEGTRSEKGVYESVEAAYQFLKQVKECDDSSITCWGYSMGAGAVTDLATKHDVDIVLDRGQTSMKDVAGKVVMTGFKTITKAAFRSFAHFNNLSKLPDARGRVLIAQESDNRKMGERLEETLRNSHKEVVYMKDVAEGHFHTHDVWFSEKGLKNPEHKKQLEDFLGAPRPKPSTDAE